MTDAHILIMLTWCAILNFAWSHNNWLTANLELWSTPVYIETNQDTGWCIQHRLDAKQPEISLQDWDQKQLKKFLFDLFLLPSRGLKNLIACLNFILFNKAKISEMRLFSELLKSSFLSSSTDWRRWKYSFTTLRNVLLCAPSCPDWDIDNSFAGGHDSMVVTYPITVNTVVAASSTAYSLANWQRLGSLNISYQTLVIRSKWVSICLMTPKRLKMGSLLRRSLCSEGAFT